MIKPPKLTPGSVIGLVTPASPITPEKGEKAIALLEGMGFRVKPGAHYMGQWGYLAGSDDERIEDLNAAFADPETDAVFCTRGGYGTIRIVHRLDFDAIRRRPKVFVGYSDITTLHIAIQREVGMVTFHAPMPAAGEPNALSLDGLKAAVGCPEPMGLMPESALHPRKALSPGVASGQLVGGNLTLITGTLGTPWEIDTRGKILVIEDVGGQPYMHDRLFAQLRLAGKFDDAAGIAFGQFTNCDTDDPNHPQTMEKILQDYFGQMAKPVVSGLPFGHEADNWTLPLGANATLNAEALTLEVTEAAVS